MNEAFAAQLLLVIRLVVRLMTSKLTTLDYETIRLNDKETKMSITVSELMEKMPGAFIPEKAVGLNVVIQFKFTGAQAGEWNASIKDGKVEVAQ